MLRRLRTRGQPQTRRPSDVRRALATAGPLDVRTRKAINQSGPYVWSARITAVSNALGPKRLGHPVSGLLRERGHDVAVDVGRRAHLAVAEQLHDHAGVDVGG